MDQPTPTPTPAAPNAADVRAAEIASARPAWARPATPPAPGTPPAPAKAPEPTNGKEALAAAAAKAEGRDPKEPTPPPAEDPANKPPADPAQAKRKYQVLVRGKQMEVELTDAQAQAMIQKGLGAESKFEEAARMHKEAKEIFGLLKDKRNFERVLQHLGYENPRAVLEEILLEHIKVEQMTPEQREAHENREKLKAMETEKEQAEKAMKAERHRRLTEHFKASYQQAIIKALPASGLPVTEETVGRIAFYMDAALHNLGKEMTPEQVLPLVKEDYQRQLRRFVTAADGNVLAELLGEDGLKKLNEIQLSRLKGSKGVIPNVPPQKGPSRGNDVPAKPNPTKGLTIEEFRERNEKIKRGELVIG